MLQESLDMTDASVCQLWQFAAILSDFLQQMQHLAHYPPISQYSWPQNRDCEFKKYVLKFFAIQWWYRINEENVAI